MGRVGLALLLMLAALGCGGSKGADQPGPAAVRPPSSPPAGLTRVQWGERIFRDQGCTACHHINGVRGVGGALDGLWGTSQPLSDGSAVKFDAAYVRRSIVRPNAQVAAGFTSSMPSYAHVLDDAEIDALVAYIESLRSRV